jgi:hypothetical protein
LFSLGIIYLPLIIFKITSNSILKYPNYATEKIYFLMLDNSIQNRILLKRRTREKKCGGRKMLAFWFSPDDKHLGYGDGRKVRVGTTHTVEGKPVLCEFGLHASERPIDALKYAPGSTLYLVGISGMIIVGEDKIVGTKRKYLARFNAEKLLREFARKQALINIEKIKPFTDKYDLIVEYLETGNGCLQSAAWSAARCAAESAAESAARSAAESAAWSAARCAAGSAARSAAESAARSAARSAAESAAWSAARCAADKMLTDMVRDATGWDI